MSRNVYYATTLFETEAEVLAAKNLDAGFVLESGLTIEEIINTIIDADISIIINENQFRQKDFLAKEDMHVTVSFDYYGLLCTRKIKLDDSFIEKLQPFYYEPAISIEPHIDDKSLRLPRYDQ